MKLFSLTDKGKKREINQDYIFSTKEPIGELPNLLIVADGMGGHNAGDYASCHTVEKVVEVIKNTKDIRDPERIIQKAIEEANLLIYNSSAENEELSGMGTTLVVATCIDDQVLVANVGDSRLYLIDDEITQITRDHSLVEEMINLGGIDRELARLHPDKNIITRAIGVKADIVADFFTVKVKAGDRILLCSDGLTNMLEDKEIYQIISENREVKDAAISLIKAANDNGGKDNIAVVLAEPLEVVND